MPDSLSSASIMSLLAFDYGKRRVGVATGQMITRTASELTTIPSPASFSNEEEGWRGITKLVAEWRPDALVIGVPYHLDGTENAMTLVAKRFAHALKERYNKPVFCVDETLSSVEAAEEIATGRAAGTHKRQVKGDLDKLSARIILQTWFNQQGG